MASVSGGQFQLGGGHHSAQVSQVRASAGHFSLASVTHSTVAGGNFHAGNDTVGSGFDTVSGPQHAGGFTTVVHAGAEQVVATHTADGGNTLLHLPDGSSITVVGVTHIDATFFH
jgi:hypothetical protein